MHVDCDHQKYTRPNMNHFDLNHPNFGVVSQDYPDYTSSMSQDTPNSDGSGCQQLDRRLRSMPHATHSMWPTEE